MQRFDSLLRRFLSLQQWRRGKARERERKSERERECEREREKRGRFVRALENVRTRLCDRKLGRAPGETDMH